jgi:outer membrane protein assembly factor BamB
MKTAYSCVVLCGGSLLLGGCATEPKDTLVTRIPTTGTGHGAGSVTVTTIPIGSRPFGLATGEGAVWVMGRNCWKIDPQANHVVGDVPAASVCTIAVGEGAVWAVKMDLFSHELRRVDPTTGKIVTTVRGITGWPTFGGGNLWVHAPGKVFRIDPQTNRLLATIPTEGVGLSHIVVGEGAIWVPEQKSYFPGSESLISQIDPSTNRVTEVIHLGPGFCTGLAIGEGAVWATQSGFTGGIHDSFTGTTLPGKLLRIDPNSNRIVRAISLPDQPTSVAFGEGSVWISTASGYVVRVDPKTNDIVEHFLIPRSGSSLVQGAAIIANGALWLGGYPNHEIDRIDLSDLCSRHPL